MANRWSRGLILAAAVLAVAAGVYAVRHTRHARELQKPIPAELTDIAPVRLAQPDALIVSANLRELPRDLLAVPLLKTALTEEFVFYYEQNEGLLGLKGTLRRIAYEHDLSLGDEVVAMMLEHPGDVALWRGADGKLKHWMINATRTDAAALLQIAAKLGNDAQFGEVGRLPLSDGSEAPLYRIEHIHGAGILFAGAGDKFLVMSDTGLFDKDDFGTAAEKAPVWKALLDGRWTASPLRRHFGLGDFAGKHALVIGADAVSFNYRQLFPQVEALRFDFDGKNWASYLRLAGDADLSDRYDTRALWTAAPADAALCLAAPIQWSTLKPVFENLHKAKDDIDPALLEKLGGPAGVCWYADAGLYSPLLMVPLKKSGDAAKTLEALFQHSVGKPADGEGETQTKGDATLWSKSLTTDLGDFQVTMALRKDWLLFSPDSKTVDAALEVLDKHRPAMADTLPPDETIVTAVVTPQSLSHLLQRVVEGDLPENREPIFHEAAQRLMLPRLEAMSQFPPYAVVLPATNTSQRAWHAVQWQALPSAR